MITELARVRSLGVRVVTVEEPAYPIRLASVAMPPHVLFVTGDPAELVMFLFGRAQHTGLSFDGPQAHVDKLTSGRLGL